MLELSLSYLDLVEEQLGTDLQSMFCQIVNPTVKGTANTKKRETQSTNRQRKAYISEGLWF